MREIVEILDVKTTFYVGVCDPGVLQRQNFGRSRRKFAAQQNFVARRYIRIVARFHKQNARYLRYSVALHVISGITNCNF